MPDPAAGVCAKSRGRWRDTGGKVARWLATGINAPLVLGFVLVVWFALFAASPYDLRVLTISGIYALLVLGFQFIFGHAGAVSLAQATFFGLGAYVTGILGAHYGMGFLITFPASMLVPGLLAAAIALPVLKLEDHYFALATLGIGLIVSLIAIQWQSVTGGTNGLPGIPGVVILDFQIGRRLPLLTLVWALVVIGALVAYQITRGLYGQAFRLMRTDDLAARCVGIDVSAMRFAAFIMSAIYAGAAGAMMAHTLRVVSPQNLEFSVMIVILTIAVIGGRTRIAGAIVGALLIIHLPEWFRVLERYYLIAYGGAALLMVIAAPKGIVGTLDILRSRWLPTPVSLPPAAAPLPPVAPSVNAMDSRLLEVRGANRSFGGVRAVDEVSLDVDHGEILGLIGPNGSGKTTLLNLISGVYEADGGEILLGGHRITRFPPHRIARLGIARTFQHINLVDELDVLDNVCVARAGAERVTLRGALTDLRAHHSLALARRQSMGLLEALGVEQYALEVCGALPYGVRRRVEIARALATQPRLLLLDEPAAGMNEQEQVDLVGRLRTLSENGLTLLVIEHNMTFMMSLAQRLVCLDYGRVIAAGTSEEVRTHPKVIEAYLGADD